MGLLVYDDGRIVHVLQNKLCVEITEQSIDILQFGVELFDLPFEVPDLENDRLVLEAKKVLIRVLLELLVLELLELLALLLMPSEALSDL